MGEATIGLWLVLVIFLTIPTVLIRIFRTNSDLFSPYSPLSLWAVIFSLISLVLYFACVVYTDKIKKLDDPTQDLINTRNWIFNSSMVSIGLCILLLLLSLKYE